MTVNKLTIRETYTEEELAQLSCCTLCPRECKVNRLEDGSGYCGTDASMNIASICIHRGEEPPISGPDGICNIFFSGCNLRCVYCQNHDISQPEFSLPGTISDLNEALDKIESILALGIEAIGFVSPSHVIPQVKAIIRGLQKRGLNPIRVYNTNGYDKAETIDSLDGLIDVWLPDYKYVTAEMALKYSDADDYPEVVLKALKRMYYQVGSPLHIDENGIAERGMLIRHLVLPGCTSESKEVLQSISDELSHGLHLSLMSQYHPTPGVKNYSELNRSLYIDEYNSVVAKMHALGFRNGYVQHIDSHLNYRPDFRKDHPFEH